MLYSTSLQLDDIIARLESYLSVNIIDHSHFDYGLVCLVLAIVRTIPGFRLDRHCEWRLVCWLTLRCVDDNGQRVYVFDTVQASVCFG